MSIEDFEDDLSELESAEDFLNYFEVPFEQKVVHVNRLHILQRFHNYLSAVSMPTDEGSLRDIYLNALSRAYDDFVNSDAKTEKVLKVYQRMEGMSTVSLDQISRSS